MKTATKKGTKFVIDLNGLELPEEVQVEISKELNKVVMKKLATLDLGADSSKMDNFTGNSAFALFDLKNGGELLRLQRAHLDTIHSAMSKVLTEMNISETEVGGFQVLGLNQRVAI